MRFERWYIVIGALLILLVVVGTRVRRLPLTAAMLYLAMGWGIGWAGWIRIDPLLHSVWLERLSEIAVIVSLFSAGLKLRLPLRARRWRLPIWLSFGSMALTVGLIAAAGVYWIGLPPGAAVILGAVLAPTDPVLASDVQVEHSRDTDRVRFTITGEAGLNDGTAFPFVMLGLGLLGLHELGAWGWKWWAVDVLWAIVGGLGSGAALGMLVGLGILYLRRTHREAVGLDHFLALGLIALSYGLAHVLHVYGFLAVFAAGLALRRVETGSTGDEEVGDMTLVGVRRREDAASDPERAPAYLAAAVLQFNEQIERIAELALVLIVGVLLAAMDFSLTAFGFAAVLLCVIRPLSVAPVAVAHGMKRAQVALVSWFGVRGIGSVYYLFYALNHHVPSEMAMRLVDLTLPVLAVSVVAHGISVTPLMRFYGESSRS